MRIYNISPILKNKIDNTDVSSVAEKETQTKGSFCNTNCIPVDYKYNAIINFTSSEKCNRSIPDIEFEEYSSMNEKTKQRFRKKYADFANYVDKNQLVNATPRNLPLRKPETMTEFIKTASIYNKYKDNQIICLGRSPKWFLDASTWMKDGIDKYKFVAFSKNWHRKTVMGLKRIESLAPTAEEEIEYRKYLKHQQIDPKSIVENTQKTGKKTVITDYICSGKGACSFLDIMSRYAEEQGVLEDFAKSIQIVGIGSIEYMEDLDPYADSIATPRVPLPEKLKPYGKEIQQDFYDMDYQMFREMLLDQNTNECRSTYYPHEMWTLYNPDRFKTGLIKDTKKLEELIKESKSSDKVMTPFSSAMSDYRNLLNFRILDGLNEAGLLKEYKSSKNA